MRKLSFIFVCFGIIVLGALSSSKEVESYGTESIVIIPSIVINMLEYNITGPLKITTLTNCDTIDTDATGVLSCGTDATGAGGAGGGHEGIYPLQNDSENMWINDVWINDTEESGLNTNASNYWDALDSPPAAWGADPYINDTEEGDLDVNSSDWWDGYDTPPAVWGADPYINDTEESSLNVNASVFCNASLFWGFLSSPLAAWTSNNDTEQMQDASGAMAGKHLLYTDADNELNVTVVSDELFCFDGTTCTYYAVYNSTSGCLETHNKNTGTTIAIC